MHAKANGIRVANTPDVIAAAGGAQSKGIVNREVMDAPGEDGILVNISRGTVVDEPALVAALKAGAALDVFLNEPDVREELLTMDHVVLQPHRASATIETRIAMGEPVHVLRGRICRPLSCGSNSY